MSTRGETGLFLLATGLIGLHVLDDNFLAPQPGTGIADHLVSGLVPLTLLALAAWSYPRLRPGYRGLLALAIALPAVLSGVEAIHYGTATGLSGDDFTGLAALATAPLLLGLGTLTRGAPGAAGIRSGAAIRAGRSSSRWGWRSR